MAYCPIDDLDNVTQNRYEAVLVASKHARHLNSQRLAKLARLMDEVVEVDIEGESVYCFSPASEAITAEAAVVTALLEKLISSHDVHHIINRIIC